MALSDFSLPFVLNTDASAAELYMMERKITPPLNLWGGEGARVPALPDGAGERVAVERGPAGGNVGGCVPYEIVYTIFVSRELTLRMDHSALTWLYSFKQPVGQVDCWLEILSKYKCKIIHNPGHLHSNVELQQKNVIKL